MRQRLLDRANKSKYPISPILRSYAYHTTHTSPRRTLDNKPTFFFSRLQRASVHHWPTEPSTIPTNPIHHHFSNLHPPRPSHRVVPDAPLPTWPGIAGSDSTRLDDVTRLDSTHQTRPDLPACRLALPACLPALTAFGAFALCLHCILREAASSAPPLPFSFSLRLLGWNSTPTPHLHCRAETSVRRGGSHTSLF